MPLTPGTRLGPYEIAGSLGAGGIGEVYKARDTRLDRTVALKVLPPEVAQDADRQARFERAGTGSGVHRRRLAPHLVSGAVRHRIPTLLHMARAAAGMGPPGRNEDHGLDYLSQQG
jgi:serine/threonine protein kinase